MKLKIDNNLDNLYIYLLNKNRKLINKYKINSTYILLDLRKYKYCYFKNKDYSSDVIALSNNLDKLKINIKDNKINIDLLIDKETNYGIVKSITLKDDKNLYYRNDKKKNIHILLPKDYNLEKEYNLLLMFDSQNIFDKNKIGNYTELNDPYDGWQVETSIHNKDYIVVGIENADIYRDNELTPSLNHVEFKDILYSLNEEGLLKGKLDHFRDFINETVFPYIFTNYKINKNEIGIAGSSSGGLASFYIGLKDYEKYSYIFTFTPATGFIKDKCLIDLYARLDFNTNKNKLPYIFYYQGKKGELEKLLFKVNKNLVENLLQSGYPKNKIETYIEDSAEHNEIMWRYAFNYAISKYISFKEKNTNEGK